MKESHALWLGRCGSAFSVALATYLLCRTAIWNGMAFIFNDTLPYLQVSKCLSAPLTLKGPMTCWGTPDRSPIFSVWLFPFTRHGLWPLVVVQSLLLAWVLWLVVRTVLGRRVWWVAQVVFLGTVILLVRLTPVGWYTGYVMPDIYGSMVYLAMFLVVYGWPDLAKWERAVLILIGTLGVTVHASHLLVACLLLAMVATCRLIFARERRAQLPPLAGAGSMILFAVVLQVGVNVRILGQFSLFGKAPAFLTARLMGDGTLTPYLRTHCADRRWALCRFGPEVEATRDDDDFLWNTKGIWSMAKAPLREEIRSQQLALAWAVFRSYPRQQMTRSLRNFRDLLFAVGPAEFQQYLWVIPYLEPLEPGLAESYAHTRQRLGTLDIERVSHRQRATLRICLVASLLALPRLWRRRNRALEGLALVVLVALPANAFVCGVLSCSAVRYQDRVLWLIPFLVAMLLAAAFVPEAKADVHPPLHELQIPSR